MSSNFKWKGLHRTSVSLFWQSGADPTRVLHRELHGPAAFNNLNKPPTGLCGQQRETFLSFQATNRAHVASFRVKSQHGSSLPHLPSKLQWWVQRLKTSSWGQRSQKLQFLWMSVMTERLMDRIWAGENADVIYQIKMANTLWLKPLKC